VTVRNLAAARLHERYEQLRANGELGGSSRLFELQKLSTACLKELSGQQRLTAFVIASLFQKLAERYSGEAILATDAEATLEGLHPYIIRVLQYMNSDVGELQATRLLVELVDSFGERYAK